MVAQIVPTENTNTSQIPASVHTEDHHSTETVVQIVPTGIINMVVVTKNAYTVDPISWAQDVATLLLENICDKKMNFFNEHAYAKCTMLNLARHGVQQPAG